MAIKSNYILINNKIVYLFLITVLLGIFSSLNPIITLLLFILIFAIGMFIKNTNYTFIYIIFFLLLQPAIAYNGETLGFSNSFIELIQRTDEFVWLFFIIIIIIKNFSKSKWEFNKSGFDVITLILIFTGVLSAIINNVSVFWAIIAIILTIKGIVIYWIARNITFKEKSIVIFFNILFYFLLICFFIGLLQYFGINTFLLPQTSRFGISTAQSIFGHHGVFGFIMGVASSLSIGVYLSTRDKKWLILSFIFMYGILISSVRRSLIGVSLGILLLFINYKMYGIKKKDVYLGLVIVILFTVFFSSRLSTITESSKLEYGVNTENVPRYLLYMGAVRIFQNKPFLGEGPGTYGSYISVINQSIVYDKLGINFWGSFYMDTYWPYILGEYGIIGVLLILIILFILFRKILYINSFQYKNKFIKGIGLGYFILFINYLIESIVSQVYCCSLPAFILFGGFGIIESLVLKINNKDNTL